MPIRLLILAMFMASAWCSDVAVVTLGPVANGSGGADIGGSIANGQVAVGTGSNQIGGSAALTFSAGTLSSNAALTIASPNLIMATEDFDIQQSTNSILGIFAANTSNGAAAKTQFTAANDVGDQLYFGITSSGFTGNPRAAFLGSSVPFDINAATEELSGAFTAGGNITSTAGAVQAPVVNARNSAGSGILNIFSSTGNGTYMQFVEGGSVFGEIIGNSTTPFIFYDNKASGTCLLYTAAASPALGAWSTAGSFAIGNKLSITTGSNATVGTAVLSGGTVTVADTAVTSSSLIFVTCQALGTVIVASGFSVTKIASTSFTVTASQATDTSTIAWWIIN